MALLMTNYNFVRPHTALRFGKTVKTPAMQAGLAKKKLSFWDVFMSQAVFLLFILIAIRLQTTAECRHQQQLPEEAPRVATFSLTTPAKAPSMFSTSIQTRSSAFGQRGPGHESADRVGGHDSAYRIQATVPG